MNFGLIGDIHANLPALEAVLRELDACGIDRIFDVGDLVSYGPFPNEVIQLARNRGIVSIQGNRDREVYEFQPSELQNMDGRMTAVKMKFLAYEWAYNALTTDNLIYLKSLPERLSVCVAFRRMLMVHDRIRPEIPQLQPDTPDSEFGRAADGLLEDVIAFGHTHIPFIREAAGKLFVNTGSVGRPGDGDPRAAYVILTVEPGRITAQLNRVSYDLDRTIEAVRRSDLPDEFALMFIRGRKLDDIVES